MNEYKVVFGEWVLEPKIVYINAHSDHEATSIVMDHYNVPKGWIISISLSKEPGVCEKCEGTGKIEITFKNALTGEQAEKEPVYLPCSSCENTTNTCKVMYNVNGGT